MAIGKASDFKIYQDQYHSAFTEVIQQESNAFNAASANALRLTAMGRRGDYYQEAFFKEVSSLVTRRDTTSVSTVTDLALTQDEITSVKLNRKVGPLAQTLDAFKKIQMSPQMFSFVLGEQFGKAAMVDMLDTSLKALVAAISGVTSDALTYDATGESSKTLTHPYMIKGLAKMGDAANRVVCWVMHSKPYFDLVQQQITDKIFETSGFAIYTGQPITFGKPVIVSDSTSLYTVSGSPEVTDYHVLGLVEDAAHIEESEERTIAMDQITGLENLVMRFQGEYAYNLSVKGFRWDTTNGGANPTSTAIGTSTNWDKSATSNKSLCGVRIKVR